MTDTPSGMTGGGKSKDILLAAQRLPSESKATPRTPIPPRKDSTLDGSSAGNRTTVSVWALLTQTRFWASMAMPKDDFSPLTCLPHDSSRGTRSPGIHSDCGSPPGTFRTLWIHERRRQRDSVGGKLHRAATNVVGHAGLGAGHQVLAAPVVAVGTSTISQPISMWLARHKNVHYHSTPTHTSWLNQSEIWFSILAGQSLKGASFCAVGELKLHIDAFIKDYNETAKPFCWTKAKVRQKRLKPCFNDQ